MNDKSTKILLIVLLLLVLFSIFLRFRQGELLEIKINKSFDTVNEQIASLASKEQPENGLTPVKDVDYRDGVDGKDGKDGRDGNDGQNGKDSVSTYKETTVIKEVPVNGKDGVNGKTPILRCNIDKNRWEISYIGTDAWKVLNGTPVACTISNIKD